jgi:hypothetical protein
MAGHLAPHVTRLRAGRKQLGSAYLVTLLALVVLTMLALALTFATQTEMLVGSNERTLQRVFYGAESTVHIAAAGILEHDKCIRGLNFQDVPAGKPGWLARSWLEYDPIYPVAAPWCNLCSINDVDEYTTNAFYKVNHQIEARAVLLVGSEEGARKTITDMIDVQPWQDFRPPLDEFCRDAIKDNQTDRNKPGI